MLEWLPQTARIFVGRRRWLKKPFVRWLPAQAMVSLRKEGLNLCVDLGDLRGPSFHVLYGGEDGYLNYEREEREAILAALPDKAGDPGVPVGPTPVFLDVGANIGLFAFYIAKRRADVQVYAFEPHPRIFECLSRSSEENRQLRVRAVDLALGDGSGDTLLFTDPTDSGGHSTRASTLPPHAHGATVRLSSIDAYVAQNQIIRVDVIKIDVQGAETETIRGAVKTLQTHRPSLLIECENEHVAVLAKTLIETPDAHYRARRIGSENRLELKDLTREGQTQLARGRLQDNYLFWST